MFKLPIYTFLTVLTVDLLATSGDITITWSSPTIPKLKSNDSDVNPFPDPITTDEESWIGSLINIGAIIGPLPYGFIAEKFGRKIGLLCIAIPHIISYLTLAFAPSVYFFYFARILGGIALGAGYTLLPMYIAEVSEDANRGMLSQTLNVFWTFGNLLSYILGPYVSVRVFNIILACVPATFFVLFLLLAPETPYYLVANDKHEKAKKSLMKLRTMDEIGIEKEMMHIKSVLEHDEHGHVLDLFKSRTHLKALGISLVLIASQQLSGIDAVLFYTQDIFESTNTEVAPEISSIIIGLVLFVSSFVAPFFADRLGRRFLLLGSAVGMTVALAAFGIYYNLDSSDSVDSSGISWLPIFSLVFYIIAFNFGFGSVPWTVSSELFPASVKPIAASLASATCYFISFIVTKFFHDLNLAMGRAGTFWLFAGCSCAVFFFTFFLVPETKGKSFKEIQMMLGNTKVDTEPDTKEPN